MRGSFIMNSKNENIKNKIVTNKYIGILIFDKRFKDVLICCYVKEKKP